MNNKTILIFLGLCLFFPSISSGGVRITPADQPVPVFIPEPQSVEYVVKSGDTLGRIGKKQGVSVKEIVAANKGVDPNRLKVGQKLIIPGKPTATAAAKPMAAEKVVAEVPAKDKTAAKKTGDKAAPTAPTAPTGQEKALTKAKLAPAEPAAPKAAPEKTEALVEAKAGKTPAAGKDAKKTGKQPVSKTVAAIKATGATETPATPADMKAYGKTGVIMNSTDVPMPIREEFLQYGKKWLDVCEQLAVGTKNNKKVRKNGETWEASYRIILKDTLGAEVKRVHYDHTPYVGHLTYGVLAYVSTGPTKEAALNGTYEEKEEHMREIFSYDGKKKAWR